MNTIKTKLESIKMTDNVERFLNLQNVSISDTIEIDKSNNNYRYHEVKEFIIHLKLRTIYVTMEQVYILIMVLTKKLKSKIDIWNLSNMDMLGMACDIYYNIG